MDFAVLLAAKLKIEAITLEIAHLRRMRFASTSESIGALHYDLFDETVGADVAALEAEIDGLMAYDAASRAAALPHVAAPTVPKRKGGRPPNPAGPPAPDRASPRTARGGLQLRGLWHTADRHQ